MVMEQMFSELYGDMYQIPQGSRNGILVLHCKYRIRMLFFHPRCPTSQLWFTFWPSTTFRRSVEKSTLIQNLFQYMQYTIYPLPLKLTYHFHSINFTHNKHARLLGLTDELPPFFPISVQFHLHFRYYITIEWVFEHQVYNVLFV